MEATIRVKIKRQDDPADPGRWLAVVKNADFAVFLSNAGQKLALSGSLRAFDVDGAEFDDTLTLREGDVVLLSSTTSNSHSSSKVRENHSSAAAASKKVRHKQLSRFYCIRSFP